MALAMPQTPQKPFPGAFINTPAPSRQLSQPGALTSSVFNRATQSSMAQSSGAQVQQGQSSFFFSQQGQGQQQVQQQQQGQQGQQLQQTQQSTTSSMPSQGVSLVERGARTINAALDQDAKYPALDNYISQGFSSDYDIPSSAAWAPFQKIKMYDIPDKIFEQYNQAQVSTMMGLFAELNHAWISIDNALYLWDYTDPNPELIGFEEQPNSITAVKLVVPRAGVFVPQISRLLVVATTSDIFLLGVASQPTPTGSKQVSLYQTRMQVSIRGINVQSIAGSAKSGRIFFAGRGDDDVYELTYQQEEKWFQNKCAKVNRTSPGYTSIMPALPFMNKAPHEFVNQLVIDDTRNVLYTLSSRSTIRVFSLKSSNDLSLSLTRSLGSIMNDLGHKVGPTSLFRQGTSIVSLSAIAATEASRLNLIAITSTGCRIFFSAVSSSYYGGDAGNPPTSMQVHHVKFPPKDPLRSAPPQQQSPQGNSLTAFRSPPSGDDANTLTETRLTARLAPGYFLAFVQKNPQAPTDLLFVTAPDSGRIGNVQDTTQQAKFPEFGLWLNLESRAEDIGEVTPPFSATGSPNGFGNELAVQFDKSATELAVLTNSGVHTFRRRRMVDIFASAIRYGGGDEGLEGEVKNFVRIYGRGETIATAIAVACGQGSDVTADARIAKVTDPEVLERARKAFIEHGGKPVLNENSITDSAPAIDNVQPSPRHQGLALYISRLLRSIWKLPVVLQTTSPTGGLQMIPAVPLSKLQNVQQDLTRLQEFLNTNKSFIEGLAGPEALGRVSTKQEEVALQGEHRALNSLLNLVSDVIEGISFVLVLFDERVEEIVMSISDDSKRQVQQMTYETLFSTSQGKDLAKDLVKAIVNRNISQGSNVDTVTDALRRRCGSFCSADDCVIFKAQEQLKRASDQNVSGETSRNLLNESLRLLQKVAGSLTFDHLRNAVQQYISLNFYAGAIQLALSVAQESDRGNRALSWVHDGSPSNDNRIQAYDSRVRCYDLIHQIISAVDQASAQEPGMMDGHPTVTAKRKQEAYDVINNSQDEVFQTNLYDWYLSQGWSDRLLDIDSPFVINYLQRKSAEEVAHADLLWRYYAHYDDFLEAAKVQLQLAKSAFGLDLEQRIEYLSRARANASTKSLGVASMGRPRQSRQELMREVSDMLDVANIQGDLLQKMKADSRLTAERRPEVLKQLNGQILPLDEIYNGYVDQAGYYDLALVVFQTADHRNATDIRGTWQNLIEGIHQETENADQILPYEAISDRVRSLGVRLSLSESTFPIPVILPMLLRYSYEYQRSIGPPTWVSDIFLDLSVPHETLVSILEAMFYNDEVPFRGRNRRFIVVDMLHVLQKWYAESAQTGGRVFGSEENALAVGDLLREVLESGGQSGLTEEMVEECRVLRSRIEQGLRR